MSIRALIVDDEPLARQRIRDLLGGERDVTVVGECRDGGEALGALNQIRTDLVFLDVQMPVMDGFEVLAELGPGPLPEIVFVTAYDRYALRAFEVHALDYLLKPFDEERFRGALDRARRALERGGGGDLERKILALLEQREEGRPRLARFAVREGERIVFVKAAEVDCIEASRNQVVLHAGGREHMIRESMADLEKRLDPCQFVRIHRSWIVNVERIREVQPWFHGAHVVVLQGGMRITSGRNFKESLRAILSPSP